MRLNPSTIELDVSISTTASGREVDGWLRASRRAPGVESQLRSLHTAWPKMKQLRFDHALDPRIPGPKVTLDDLER